MSSCTGPSISWKAAGIINKAAFLGWGKRPVEIPADGRRLPSLLQGLPAALADTPLWNFGIQLLSAGLEPVGREVTAFEEMLT